MKSKKILSLLSILIISLTYFSTNYSQTDNLLLWNKLGSNIEAVNSEFGPKGTTTGTMSYYDTKFEKGVQPSGGGSSHSIHFDASILDPDEGCVEFWYQNFSHPEDVNGSGHEFHGMIGSPFDGTKDENIGISYGKYMGTFSYGLTLRFNVAAGRNITIYEQIPLGLHHIAAVWNRNGINGSGDYIRFYLDGKLKGVNSTENDWGTSSTGIMKVAVNKGTFNPPPTQCYSVDNLKIWNYAKTDFSDRFYEGLADANLVYYGNLTLSSQADVDSFPFTGVNGLLYISGKDINDLTPLAKLKSVTGLYIQNNPLLKNLNGLENLSTVKHYLVISQNSTLMSLEGLESITFVYEDIIIDNNPALKNLKGLQNIKEGPFFFDIFENSSLLSLDGLEGLESIGTDLSIYNNNQLTSLSGLQNILSIGRDLAIYNNINLISFCSLYPLLSVDGVAGVIKLQDNLYNPTVQEIVDDGPCSPKIISYEITLPDCENSQDPLVVEAGKFAEGKSCTFPEYQLPIQYVAYQPFYNALVDVEFGIPIGSLSEDIKIAINLEGICQNGLLDNPETLGIIELFFLNIEIIGAVSGSHSPLEYYYFNNGKEAYISIPLTNIEPLMDLLDFNLDQLIPFFTANGLNPDFSGIRKVIDATHYTIFAEHFSELKIGILSSPTEVIDVMNDLPNKYKLFNNYPNPFNPNTEIRYQLPERSVVTIKIYNVMGQEINTLVDQIKEPGTYQNYFNGSNISSGIYYCVFKANDYRETIKMILLK